MQVFFHSDDACLSKTATEKILTCWEKGYIDGFSMLANPDHFDLVKMSILKNRHRSLRFSVHLNLTDCKSVLPQNQVSMLVAKSGIFKIPFTKALLILAFPGKKRKKFLDQVYQEWDAQINLIKTSFPFLEIHALDSHNHIHLIPSFFKIVNDLASKHGVKNVRVADEPFHLASISDLWKTTYVLNVVKWLLLRLFSLFSKARKGGKYQAGMGVLYSGQMFSKSVQAGIESAFKTNYTALEIFFHVGRCSNDELTNLVRSESSLRFFTHVNRDLEFNTVKNLRNEK